jgi:hypothetical protein
MDRLDSDLAALATVPAPPAMHRLEGALHLHLMAEPPPLGWPLRGALAGMAMAMGLALGLHPGAPTRPAEPLHLALITDSSALLPSTLLASRP